MIKIMLLSVIIPVYNAEKYLKKCIESLLKQTQKSFELIFVNDGSKDKSPLILNKLEAEYSFVKVIHKKNEGLSSARNAGMKIAIGEYIFFLDADDWIEDDYFEKCIDILENKSVSILFTPYMKEYNNKKVETPLFYQDSIYFSKNEVQKKLLLRLFGPIESKQMSPMKLDNLNTAWGKFYKKEIIKNLEFTDREIIGTAEDLWFNVQAFYQAKDAYYLGTQYLHYNKTNANSLVSTYHSQQNRTAKNLFLLMDDFAKKNNLNNIYRRALNNRIILSLFGQILSLCYSQMNFFEKNKYCKRIIDDSLYDNAFNTFDYSNMHILWRLFYKAVEKRHTYFIICIISLMIALRKSVYNKVLSNRT